MNVAYRITEYFSSLKGNKVLIHTTAWINFEKTILSERNQTHKDKYHAVSLIQDTWNHQIHGDRH